MAEIELTRSTLIIHLKGLDRISASLANVPLEIPLAHIAGVEFGPDVIVKWHQMKGQPRSLEKHMHPFGGPPEPKGVRLPIGSFKKEWSWGAQISLGGGGTIGKGGVEMGPLEVEKKFFAAHDPRKAIVITLTNERYTKLVLAVEDPAATAARITEAVEAYKS